MTGPQAGFERRIHGALDAAPLRIPVILGGCGTGRTWLLQHVRERAGRQASQYIDVERSATTPERFLQAVISSSPVSYTHLRAHETGRNLVCRLLLEKKNK